MKNLICELFHKKYWVRYFAGMSFPANVNYAWHCKKCGNHWINAKPAHAMDYMKYNEMGIRQESWEQTR